MNNGIKKKLEELIGKEVGLTYLDSGIIISYPITSEIVTYKVVRIEDDCVVLERDTDEIFISIDHIPYIRIRK